MAKTIAWTAATVVLLPLGGSDSKIPGDKRKKRMAEKMATAMLFIVCMYIVYKGDFSYVVCHRYSCHHGFLLLLTNQYKERRHKERWYLQLDPRRLRRLKITPMQLRLQKDTILSRIKVCFQDWHQKYLVRQTQRPPH